MTELINPSNAYCTIIKSFVALQPIFSILHFDLLATLPPHEAIRNFNIQFALTFLIAVIIGGIALA